MQIIRHELDAAPLAHDYAAGLLYTAIFGAPIKPIRFFAMHADDHRPGSVVVRRVGVAPVGGIGIEREAVIIILGKKIQTGWVASRFGRRREIFDGKQFSLCSEFYQFAFDRFEGFRIDTLPCSISRTLLTVAAIAELRILVRDVSAVACI